MSRNSRTTLTIIGFIALVYFTYTLNRLSVFAGISASGQVITIKDFNSFPHPDYWIIVFGEWLEKNKLDPIKALLVFAGLLLVAIGITGVFTAYNAYRLFRILRPIRGKCPICLYDLTLVTKLQCPECGCTLHPKHLPDGLITMDCNGAGDY